MLALTALNKLRARVKPVLPPWAHKLLRMAWHHVALPPLRLASQVRELAGADRSGAPPTHLLAQYAYASAEEFLPDGDVRYEMIRRLLSEQAVSLPQATRILDFGCGLAAALLAFQRHLPKATCHGCDVRQDPVGWLARHHGELKVVRNAPLPPLPDDFSNFDLVYAISVWTHMPAVACSAWIAHMHSRLNMGGCLLFTFVEPSTDLVRRHGFDPATLPDRVRANGGCLFDSGTEMTYIQKEWIERQAEGKFKLRYVGPTEYVQWGALLQRNA